MPEKLQRYVSKRHFLHASQLLVETVKNLDGNLVHVEALRDLRASLHSQKTVLHETIIDELNRQIYAAPQKPVKKGDMRPEAFNKNQDFFEDLQKDPEDNQQLNDNEYKGATGELYTTNNSRTRGNTNKSS